MEHILKTKSPNHKDQIKNVGGFEINLFLKVSKIRLILIKVSGRIKYQNYSDTYARLTGFMRLQKLNVRRFKINLKMSVFGKATQVNSSDAAQQS